MSDLVGNPEDRLFHNEAQKLFLTSWGASSKTLSSGATGVGVGVASGGGTPTGGAGVLKVFTETPNSIIINHTCGVNKKYINNILIAICHRLEKLCNHK